MDAPIGEARRVLVIDDSPTCRRVIAHLLEEEADEVIQAEDAESGLAAARHRRPDLVLLDLNLPGRDGFDVIRTLKADPRTAAIPVIFLSAIADTRVKVRGLDLGAVDFVTKPFEEIDLRARVRVALRSKTMRDLLEQRAHLDALTGLGNRHALDDRLRADWASCRRRAAPLALLVADLDGFKEVNDRLGHPAGDAVLRGVARALRESIRDGDFVGRYGGDEFVIIAPDCDAEGARLLADRCTSRIGTIRPGPDPEGPAVSASLGVGISTDADDTPEDLLRRADRSLYEAKSASRNRSFLALA